MRLPARQALGAEAAVAGRVGDDAGGRLLLAHLAAHGVRAEIGIDPTAPTGTVLVVDGEIRADRGANSRYAPEHLPALEADVVLVSGHLPAATVAAALERAQAPWVALDAARLTTLPAAAPVVLANEAAARRMTGADAEEAVRQLADGRRLACVTLGADGRGRRLGRSASTVRRRRRRMPTSTPPERATRSRPRCWSSLRAAPDVPEALAVACDAGAAVARAGGGAAVLEAR